VISEKESGTESETAASLTDETSTGKQTKRERVKFLMGKPVAHILVSCSMYSALYTAAVPLEVAYQFKRFGHTATMIMPFVFVVMLTTSVLALALDREFVLKEKSGGLKMSVLGFILSAGVLFAAISFFLPAFPITESILQTHPAQAAYLKDESYFILLALFFLIMPFHFIIITERRLTREMRRRASAKEEGQQTSKEDRVPYWSFWALVGLLFVFFIMSVAMTARLLDNLKPSPYQNLFVQLVYLRGLLFFGLGIECLAWYHNALNEIKSEYSSLESMSSTPR